MSINYLYTGPGAHSGPYWARIKKSAFITSFMALKWPTLPLTFIQSLIVISSYNILPVWGDNWANWARFADFGPFWAHFNKMTLIYILRFSKWAKFSLNYNLQTFINIFMHYVATGHPKWALMGQCTNEGPKLGHQCNCIKPEVNDRFYSKKEGIIGLEGCWFH